MSKRISQVSGQYSEKLKESNIPTMSYWLNKSILKKTRKKKQKNKKKQHMLWVLIRISKIIINVTQLAFYVNLHRAVIGPSATLTGRWRPDIDLRWMLTGKIENK